MNARQAARAAAKRIEELERVNELCRMDIKGLYGCIEHMIRGGSPCEWCEEQIECQLQAKTDGRGCSEWFLVERQPIPDQGTDQDQQHEQPENPDEIKLTGPISIIGSGEDSQ